MFTNTGVIDCLNNSDSNNNPIIPIGNKLMSNVTVNVNINNGEKLMVTSVVEAINELKTTSIEFDNKIAELSLELEELEVQNKEADKSISLRREQLIASNKEKEDTIERLYVQVEAARKSLEEKEQVLSNLVNEEDTLNVCLEDMEDHDLDILMDKQPSTQSKKNPSLTHKDKIEFLEYFGRNKYPVKLKDGDYDALIKTLYSKNNNLDPAEGAKCKLEWLNKFRTIHNHMFSEEQLADINNRISEIESMPF